jgi:hypothetical protein
VQSSAAFPFLSLLGRVRTLGAGDKAMVRLWAANTDLDWFDYLANQPEIDEVNFWQPSGHGSFSAIGEGELFLFKRVVVSDRVRTEFNNGDECRRLQGERLRLPPNPKFHPDPARPQWHRDERFAA